MSQFYQSNIVINPEEPKMIHRNFSLTLSQISYLSRKNGKIKTHWAFWSQKKYVWWRKKNTFFLSEWARISDIEEHFLSVMDVSIQSQIKARLTSQDLIEEIKALALFELKMNNVDFWAIHSIRDIIFFSFLCLKVSSQRCKLWDKRRRRIEKHVKPSI